MSRAAIGWMFVAVQIALLALLVLLPSRGDWATPGWLVVLAWFVSIFGALVVFVAASRLGSSLTPTPVPTANGELKTSGLYAVVRHPIYTGVLTIVAGIVLRSGSTIHALLGVATVAFFILKSSWEETQLRTRYVGYDEYAKRVPRFLPRVGD